MKVIPFTMEHGQTLDITIPLNRLYDYTQGPSYTLIAEDKVVCAFGVMVMWEKVGVAWGMLGPDFRKYKLFVTRNAKRMLGDVQRALSLDRIEVQCLPNEMYKRWLCALGFEREYGIARKYINGQNVVRFEMIKGD